MKKLLLFAIPLLLIGCTKYQETGLLCEDATHNSGQAQITLDVNGENVTLKAQERDSDGSNYIAYYGTNAAGEQVKLNIIFSKNGKKVEYMLGVNSEERTYGCYKK